MGRDAGGEDLALRLAGMGLIARLVVLDERGPVGMDGFPRPVRRKQIRCGSRHGFFVTFVPSWWKIADFVRDGSRLREAPIAWAGLGWERRFFHQ